MDRLLANNTSVIFFMGNLLKYKKMAKRVARYNVIFRKS